MVAHQHLKTAAKARKQPSLTNSSNPNRQPRKQVITLKRINIGLLLIIILINAYTVSIPFLPAVFSTPKAPTATTSKTFTVAAIAGASQPTSQTNRLIIPSIQLNQEIFGGTNTYAGLDKGVWRWPGGSTPDSGSNTVLLGHRFTYTKPQGVFYFLDRLQMGDEITIVWNGQTYTYKISETKVVTPSSTEILAASDQPILTIYTCTPLWNPVNRLVVVAQLEKQS